MSDSIERRLPGLFLRGGGSHNGLLAVSIEPCGAARVYGLGFDVSLMGATELKIERIDTRQDDVRRALAGLGERLSPRGEIVSAAGRGGTIACVGEPVSPQPAGVRVGA